MAHLSDGKCPGWLDEGLAQIAEDVDRKELKVILENWLDKSDPIDLKILSNGFIGLDEEMIAPAYAQSLFATDFLQTTVGEERIGQYLQLLRRSESKSFTKSFGIDLGDFEKHLARRLKHP